MEMAMVKEEEDHQAFDSTKPLLFVSPSFHRSQESDTEEDRFEKSLRELKQLRTQLNHAADYCESAFLKGSQKKMLLGNTKNYICEAIVTVVDHLGTVSSNLEQRINGNIKLSQTEQRINCLKQSLLTCQNYAFSLDISTLQLSTKFPRHNRHYVSVSQSAQHPIKPKNVLSVSPTNLDVPDTSPSKKDQFTVATDKQTFDVDANMKLHLNTLVPGIKLGTVVPASEGPSTPSKTCNPSFGSPAKDSFKLESSDQKKMKKTSPVSNFLSFLKASKRRR